MLVSRCTRVLVCLLSACLVYQAAATHEAQPSSHRIGEDPVGPDAPSWGPVGHEMTASVAQTLLTHSIKAAVSHLLHGQTLSDVSDWADAIKRSPAYAWSADLHFINTPAWKCDFEYKRDCKDDACVAGAILNYTRRVVDKHISQRETHDALKFLIHFVGDIHQPLHVGFKKDEGGNFINGKFEGSHLSLHMLWDDALIRKRVVDFPGGKSNYTQYLVAMINGVWAANATSWASCVPAMDSGCVESWADESVALACNHAYKDSDGDVVRNGFSLGDPYYHFNAHIVDLQICKGGARLAHTLNRLLGSSKFAPRRKRSTGTRHKQIK